MPGGAQLTDVGARPNIALARPHFAVVSRDTVRTVANSDYIDIHNLRNITYVLTQLFSCVLCSAVDSEVLGHPWLVVPETPGMWSFSRKRKSSRRQEEK